MNRILSKYFYELDVCKHEKSIAKRIKPLRHYFSFLAEEMGVESEDDISEDHIEKTNIEIIKKYEMKLEDLDYSLASIREKLIIVKSFYTYYINDTKDHIPINHPFDGFVLPKRKNKDIKLYEPNYYINFVSNIFNSMKNRNRAIATMLMTTGIKLKDLVNLTMNDLTFDEHDQPVEMHVSGRKIPLNKAVKISLCKYFDEERSNLPNVETNAVFLSRNSKTIHVSTIDLMLRSQAKTQNLEHDTVSSYALRTLAIATYRQYGGGDTGIRDFFGKSIRGTSFETTNIQPFFDNPLINGLYTIFSPVQYKSLNTCTHSNIAEHPYDYENKEKDQKDEQVGSIFL